jgi:predicted phosphohydrolase
MIIQYCSDLHLEFPENHKYISNNPIKPVGDILILAGDILAFCMMDKRKNFFDYIADHFAVTYWIPGNHEYYDSDISERSGALNEKIRDNIFLVNNNARIHGSTRIILSTLWSKISEVNQWRIENYISDFKAIRFRGKFFTADTFNSLHLDSLNFISAALEEKWVGNTVVVTHHVPTLMHYPKKYKGNSLNEVFAAELGPLIEKTSPNYWIYGHHHVNTPAFNMGITALLTNQLGYVHHYEYGSFDGGKHIVL